jgi:aryl-alcohol dehydrogenase-like predicted oxidoreductase
LTARLCLGTAQFGMDYGVANRRGMPSDEEVRSIVSSAFEGGVRWVETAPTYGEAERRLGSALRELGVADEMHVVGKLGPAAGTLDRAQIRSAFDQTLDRLGVSSLAVLLLHRSESVEGWEKGLGEFVEDALASGTIGRFGISIDDPRELRHAAGRPSITAFQCPLNALDRRFADPSLFADGSRLFLRSVYLQGLLLLDQNDIQRKLSLAEGPIAQLRRFVTEAGVDWKTFLLGYSLSTHPDGIVVVGVESADQIRENLVLISGALEDRIVRAVAEWNRLDRPVPESVIDPAHWRTPA